MQPIDASAQPSPDFGRIVFLGDSITDDGTYISFLDSYFFQHQPDHRPAFVNLGVSSETASGLSEPDHPFPRPCIHDRLESALRESRPDTVVFCYGMNDGIYHPFSEERFAAYRTGILKLIQAIKSHGAEAVAMTPPPFDPLSLQGAALQPDGADNYSYQAPYENYDAVLQRYGEWLRTLDGTVDGIVEIYEPLRRHFETEKNRNSAYVSGDGIHPNADGHWVIAKTLLRSLFGIAAEEEPEYVRHPYSSPFYRLVLERHRLLSAAWKEHVGHTNVNKAQALPLDLALARGEQLAEEIRRLSK